MSAIKNAAESDLRKWSLGALHEEIARLQHIIANAGIPAVRLCIESRHQLLQAELDRRISAQHNAKDCRYTLNLTLANLTWSERDLVNSIVALLSDPALDEQRGKVIDGEVAIAMEGGEVTWIPTSELEAS